MRVEFLSLIDFRNYSSAEVRFTPGQNLILGRNGQGKTNLVEAIAYFATLRSHRIHGDSALIKADQPSAVARMSVAVNDRSVLLETQIHRAGANKAQINRGVAHPRDLTRWFSAVVFAPEDLMIVRGEPAGRRKFLDDAVITRNPAAAGIISDYERVVKQRNALLKSARNAKKSTEIEATLSIWDEQLTDLGSRVMYERRLLIEALQHPIAEAYAGLVGDNHHPLLSLAETVSRETVDAKEHGSPRSDVSRETLREDFRRVLKQHRSQEGERGTTLFGPHRDDLTLELNGLPVKGYASHGESWSFSLSLRLALADLLRQESPGGDPVIILDDVFAELDVGRRERLMTAVGEYEQVIVTAAVEGDVPNHADWNTVVISGGSVMTGPEHNYGSETGDVEPG